MKNQNSHSFGGKIKFIIIIFLIIVTTSALWAAAESMKDNSLFNNILNIIEFAITIPITFIIYKPLQRLFKPVKISDKMICIAASVIILSVEISGLIDILMAIFNSKKMPKYWYVYTIILIVITVFTYKASKKKAYTMSQLDTMEGHRFEYACADILKFNGFKNVTVTQGSGDYGIDIIAEKQGIKYGIQCKCYSNKLDNTPIQEAKTGLAYWKCTKGAVMTNQYFTAPARELAQVNGIELWDRDVLEKMLYKTKATLNNRPGA